MCNYVLMSSNESGHALCKDRCSNRGDDSICNVIPETEEKKNTAAFDLIDLDKKTTDKEKFSASLLSGFLVKVLRVTGYLKGTFSEVY